MNANVNPVVATIVILLTICAAGLWMWSSGRAIEIGGPAELAVSPSGHLFVQMQNRLLEHGADGTFIAEHDLSRINTDVVLGGFDFFSDGTLLIRRGPDPRLFGDNLRSFQRGENLRPLTPQTPDTGLARCHTGTWECVQFGAEPVDFGAAISIAIDRSTDTVYISDTTRHMLRKYSAEGISLAEPTGGFRFPNDLELHDGKLFVADTNSQFIRQVETDRTGFGQPAASHNVVPNLAEVAGRKWPGHFTRVGDEWWVNNMSSAMDSGGIYIFDDDWSYLRRVSLPNGADPIALVSFRGEVLISDWNNDRVHRVSVDGELIGDFLSEGLAALVEHSESKRFRYRMYGYAGVLNIVLLIGLLIAKGTDWSQANRAPVQASTRAPRQDEPIAFEPEPHLVRKFTIGLRVAAILLLSVILMLGATVIIVGSPQLGAQLALPALSIVAIFAMTVWFQKSVTNSSIRFDTNRITLQDHTGREVSSPYNAVVYSGAAVLAGELAVFLGQPHMPVYDREELFAVLAERVPAEQRISEFRMQMKLIAVRHPQGMLIVVSIFAALIVGGVLLVLDALG